MADLPNAGEDSPRRTRVFVNHVDLFSGKNISKVRKIGKEGYKDELIKIAGRTGITFLAAKTTSERFKFNLRVFWLK